MNIMNKSTVFLEKEYEEFQFFTSESSVRLGKDDGSPGDDRLVEKKIFRKQYRVPNPSVIVAHNGSFIPLPERGKAIVSNTGRILHSQIGGVYDKDRFKLISEVGYIPDFDEKRINGTLLDLTSEGSALYSFWLLEAAIKLNFLDSLPGTPTSGLHLLVNQITPFVKETIKLFGLSGCKLHNRNNSNYKFVADILVTVDSPRLDRYTPKWGIEFLRESFLEKRHRNIRRKPTKKIYISRQKSNGRKIINSLEFEDYLRRKGFSIVFAEDMGVKDTIDVMACAEYVISPHGAGLTNILFASDRACVIELFGAHYTTQYRLLAHSLEHQYYTFDCIVPEYGKYFDEFDNGDFSIQELNKMDMYVDMDRFSKFIESIDL